MKNLIKITSLILVFSLLSCNRNSQKADNYVIKNTVNAVESFDKFNIRFHKDSIFQLSRINFPIEGKSIDGFDKQEWSSKNWEMLKTPVVEKSENKEYEHSLVKSDTLVIEKYWIKDSGFLVERKFKKIKNKWFLTYYNDVNL